MIHKNHTLATKGITLFPDIQVHRLYHWLSVTITYDIIYIIIILTIGLQSTLYLQSGSNLNCLQPSYPRKSTVFNCRCLRC